MRNRLKLSGMGRSYRHIHAGHKEKIAEDKGTPTEAKETANQRFFHSLGSIADLNMPGLRQSQPCGLILRIAHPFSFSIKALRILRPGTALRKTTGIQRISRPGGSRGNRDLLQRTAPGGRRHGDGCLILIGTEGSAAYNGLKDQTAGQEKDFGKGDAMSMNFAPRRRSWARRKPPYRGYKPGFQCRIRGAEPARRFIRQEEE
jgi:hypothetical protein